MANIINNLLKLTDYPFAYSVAGLVLSMSGQASIWQNPSVNTILPFVTLAGLLATSLTITDPFGNLLRFVLKKWKLSRILDDIFRDRRLRYLISKAGRTAGIIPVQSSKGLGSESESEDFYFSKYFKSLRAKATSTNWISYEIDKIVSIFYFSIVLLLIIISVGYQHSVTYLQY